MIPVVLVHAGMITGFVGLISVMKPFRFARLHQRRHGFWLLAAGVALALVGWNLPAGTTQVNTARTELDRFVPAYQFSEFHSIRVNAPKQRVYEAIKQVRADEIFLFRTLTWIRRFGRPGPESILNAPDSMPILEVATRTTFLTLAEKPGEELLVGTVVLRPRDAQALRTPEAFRTLTQPGIAVAAMNFRLEDAANNTTTVSTETRVYANDDHSRRRLARYWRTIYPGSAFIRRMWLRAVRNRAEAGIS